MSELAALALHLADGDPFAARGLLAAAISEIAPMTSVNQERQVESGG